MSDGVLAQLARNAISQAFRETVALEYRNLVSRLAIAQNGEQRSEAIAAFGRGFAIAVDAYDTATHAADAL